MFRSKPVHQACMIALTMLFPAAAMAADAPAGQVLFVSGEVKIVDALGVERIARKGDRIGPDEHVRTGGGAIGQIKMPDGSLIGVRPDSDLRFDKPKPGDGNEHVVFLSKGAVRVVNVESGAEKLLPLMLQTPTASIGLRNADNESMVVPRPVAGAPTPPVDPGTYSRMAVGSGILKTTGGETPLAPSQTGFAAIGSTTLPTKIAALPVITTISPVSPPVVTSPVVGGTTLPPRVAVPIAPIALSPSSAIDTAGLRLPPPTSTPSVIAPLKPIAIVPISPIIIQPIKPPTLVDTGSIDVSMVSPTKLATLPPATLAQLPTATLNTLPTATLATLPLDTIKSLSPTVQTSVTPLLTTTQQTTLTTTVAAPVKTTTIVPITTTTTLKTRTLLIR